MNGIDCYAMDTKAMDTNVMDTRAFHRLVFQCTGMDTIAMDTYGFVAGGPATAANGVTVRAGHTHSAPAARFGTLAKAGNGSKPPACARS